MTVLTMQKNGAAVRGAFAALAVAGVIAMLTACGANPQSEGSGELKSGNEQAAYEDWQREFAECMGDEGVDLGEAASTGGDAVGGLEEGSTDGPTMSVEANEIDMELYGEASRICTEKVGEMPVPPGMMSPEEMQKSMLVFAKCMREAGYDYPDPEIGKDGSVSVTAMGPDDFDPAVTNECGKKAGFEGISVGATISGSAE